MNNLGSGPAIKSIKKAHVVYTNSDCTEGKGYNYPIYVCENQFTAKRLGKNKYIQGTDCPISERNLYLIDNTWYGPINLIKPSKDDALKAQKIAEEEKFIEKIKDLGLTKEDILKIKTLDI